MNGESEEMLPESMEFPSLIEADSELRDTLRALITNSGPRVHFAPQDFLEDSTQG